MKATESRKTDRSSEKPFVFVSHDSRDAEIAERFCELLDKSSTGLLRSFCSADRKGQRGIEYGAQWFQTVLEKLLAASAVVCLLTPRSVSRPWILYEAGVATGKPDTPVQGVLLGLSLGDANQGPFAQLQNCPGDAGSIAVLVSKLIRKLIPDASPSVDLIKSLADEFVKSIAPLLEVDREEGKSDHRAAAKVSDSALTAKMLEEIKELVYGLPIRVEKTLSQSEIPDIAVRLSAALQAAQELRETTKQTLEANAQVLHDRVEEIHAIVTGQLGKIPAMPALVKCGILNIHEDRPSAESHILEVLTKAKDHVEVIGISLRGLFQGGGKLNKAILNLFHSAAVNKSGAPRWRVMVLDPESDQARYRAEREEPPGTPLEEATLFNEVHLTVKAVESLRKKGCNIELRAYKGSPSCFVMVIDDVIFVEQYHYGRAGGVRVAELVPLLELSSDSTTYRELLGHFDYMWDKLSRAMPVSAEPVAAHKAASA